MRINKPSFGTRFILVSDVQQPLPPTIFGGGRWELIGVAQRGFREYAAIRMMGTDKVYLEEVDGKDPNLFKRIEDDELWKDLQEFFRAAGIFHMDGEKKRATE